MKKLPILILCALMCASPLTGCGKKEKGDGMNYMADAPLLGNPGSLDPQYADDPSSNTVIKNLYSGLLRVDEAGNISCENAESYTVSDDGRVYTFNLRKDNFWFYDLNDNDIIEDSECFPVTANDYVFALKRVLDPKMQSPYASEFACIKNADRIIGGSASPDSLGVFALDSYTLAVTLDYPSAEFLTLMTTAPSFPCNEEFFNSTKGRYGLDDRSVMSNGAFFVRQWFYDPYGTHNILYMKRNDKNSREELPVCPSYLSFTIEKNIGDIRTCLKDDKIECLSALSSSYSSKKYTVSESCAYTLGLIFNPKDQYFSNRNLRTALAYSVDREQLEKDTEGIGVKVANGIIPPSVNLAGRSYRELSSDKQFDCYDPAEAQRLMEKAKSELGIASLSNVKILVCADIINSGSIIELSQNWQDKLGVYIGIEDVTYNEFMRRIEEEDYSIALYPLKGRIGTPSSVFGQFETVDCLKTASTGVKYSDWIMQSDSLPSLVERCTDTEKAVLSACGFIPVFYKTTYFVTKKGVEDIIFDPFTEAADFRFAKNYS